MKHHTTKDLETFKKHCERYRKLFGLVNYTFYYELKSEGSGVADSRTNPEEMLTLVRLDKKKSTSGEDSLKRLALHEVLHVLCARVMWNARARYVSDAELNESHEELVSTLENVLHDKI